LRKAEHTQTDRTVVLKSGMLAASPFKERVRMQRRNAPFAWHDAYLRSFDRWLSIGRDSASMLWAAGDVIGMRTTRMAVTAHAPSADDLAEIHRMVAEKPKAFAESQLAVWNALLQSMQTMWADALRQSTRNAMALSTAAMSPSPGLSLQRVMTRGMASAMRQLHAPLKIAEAATQPVNRRVAANRQRLLGAH
jgi:hypothetical protein